MLFRPSFCANCGEKIDRAEWFIWTSRRFCQVCESEYKGQDLIPRVVVIGGVLIGILGFSSYLNSGSPGSDLKAIKNTKKSVEQKVSQPPLTAENATLPRPQKNGEIIQEPTPQREISSNHGTSLSAPLAKPKLEVNEPVFYCRAETKKGTPCSRRVKGNVRCYQHVGMPAMPVEK